MAGQLSTQLDFHSAVCYVRKENHKGKKKERKINLGRCAPAGKNEEKVQGGQNKRQNVSCGYDKLSFARNSSGKPRDSGKSHGSGFWHFSRNVDVLNMCVEVDCRRHAGEVWRSVEKYGVWQMSPGC